MQVWAISRKGDFYRIGENKDTKDWYGLSTAVAKFLESGKGTDREIQRFDEVEIQFDRQGDREKTLTLIKKVGNGYPKPVNSSGSGTGVKSVDVNEQIRKLSVLRAVGTGISAISGQFQDVEALGEAMCILYDKLYVKVNG